MSGKNKHSLGYKQAANVERRTWDLEKYKERAKDRTKREDISSHGKVMSKDIDGKRSALSVSSDDDKEEFQSADDNRAKPMFSERAFLKARTGKVDLESKLHTREIISAEDVAGVNKEDGVTKRAGGAGWFCKVCDCILKDSLTYLDHINGRKHQRALGYSMRTEKSSLTEVEEKLAMLKRKREEDSSKNMLTKSVPEKSDEDRIKELNDEIKGKDEERARLRAERKRKKKEKKIVENTDEEEFEAAIDPALAAMMGFSGFGGS